MSNLSGLIGLLNKILEVKIPNDDQYDITTGIGNKLMLHVNSIDILLNNTIDISSCITLTRTVLETFAVFNTLFVGGSEEEKRLRFNLWKIDALKTRQKFHVSYEDFSPEEQNQFKEQIEDERKQIEELKDIIRNDDYYKTLPDGYNKALIKNAVWKFDLGKIEGYHKKTRIDMGIKSMVEKCGIREIYLQDIYNYTSMHAHTNYISILQSDQIDVESFQVTKDHLGDVNSVLITYFITSYLEYYNLKIEDYCNEEHVYYIYRRRL